MIRNVCLGSGARETMGGFVLRRLRRAARTHGRTLFAAPERFAPSNRRVDSHELRPSTLKSVSVHRRRLTNYP